jgi:hypothetical protein
LTMDSVRSTPMKFSDQIVSVCANEKAGPVA